MYFPFRLGKFSEMVPIKGRERNRDSERDRRREREKMETLQEAERFESRLFRVPSK